MRLALAIFSTLLFSSCFDFSEYSKSIEIDADGWNSNDCATFEWNILSLEQRYDCIVDFRHESSYPYSNLYLFLDLEYPNGKHRIDTLECTLADKRGNWYGSGLGDIVDHQIQHHKSIQFPLHGHYKLEITHGMRHDPLVGVTDLGYRLEVAE